MSVPSSASSNDYPCSSARSGVLAPLFNDTEQMLHRKVYEKLPDDRAARHAAAPGGRLAAGPTGAVRSPPPVLPVVPATSAAAIVAVSSVVAAVRFLPVASVSAAAAAAAAAMGA